MSDQQLQRQPTLATSEQGRHIRPPELAIFLRECKSGDEIPDTLFVEGRAISFIGLTQERRRLYLKALGEFPHYIIPSRRKNPNFSLHTQTPEMGRVPGTVEMSVKEYMDMMDFWVSSTLITVLQKRLKVM